MLAQCVNPDCCAPLQCFSEGRLYQFEIVSISIAASDASLTPFDERPERMAAHYWLCGRCAANLNLRLEPLQGLRIVPLATGEETTDDRNEPIVEQGFQQGNRC